MARTPLISLNGTEVERQAAAAFIDPDELNTTTDQHRVFLGDILIGPEWLGIVASEAAMLDLFNTHPRGCFPGDECYRSDNRTLYRCIARLGLDLEDWFALITTSTDITLGGVTPSDDLIPTQKAIKTYADTKEPALGNPGTTGFVLSSTTGGVRSWVAAGVPALTSAHIFVGNVSNVATDVAMTGDISITNAGLTAIGANKVTLAMMAPIANNTVLGNISGGAAVPSALSGANVRTICGLATTDNVVFNTLQLGGTPAASLYSTGYELLMSNTVTTETNLIVASSLNAMSRGVYRATRSRNTLASPAAVQSGDWIFSLIGAGHDGTSSVAAAEVLMECTGAVSAGVVPMAVLIQTGSSGSRTETARFSAAKNLLVGTTSETGLTGAGGLSVGSATESSTSATGSIITAGGVGIAKKLYVGTDAYVLGLLYAGSGPTTLTNAAGKILSAALNTVAIAQGGTGLTSTSQNYAFIGPTAGAGAPTWRLLVAGDIPALSYAPSALTSAHIFVGNVSNVATNVAMTGDISITNAGLTAIGANKVTLAMMATIANNTVLGNISGGAAVPSALTGANVRTICGLATTDTPTFASFQINGPALGHAFAQLMSDTDYGAGFKMGELGGGYQAAIIWNFNVGPGLEFYTGGVTTANCNMYLDQNGKLTLRGAGGLQTPAPAGGTAGVWKLGILVTTASVFDTTRYIQLDVGGVLYKVAVCV